LPNAYKIKQINNKANHLLEFEYTLLGSTSTVVLVLGTQYLYLYLHTVYL